MNLSDDYELNPPPPYSALSARRSAVSMDKNNDLEPYEVFESASIISDATTYVSIDSSSQDSFHPTRHLQIDARGVGFFRRVPIPLPLPDSQLEIPIFDRDSGSLMYTSTRSKMHSGDAILRDARDSSGGGREAFRTKYLFGPGRDPVLYRLPLPSSHPAFVNDDSTGIIPAESKITTTSQWTSRAISFPVPAHNKRTARTFEWTYGKHKDPHTGKRVNLLVLRYKPDFSKDEKILAELIRSEETRPRGSTRVTAGNGGLLRIDQDAEQYLDESLVVATCLIMLKREVDRRRMCQTMMITAAVGGGF
jgi:hypothetical protein